ncbi:MAG: trigger factor [Bacteroidales bacterium]|nr:trigger factor [Bacteroidales bacterium]
MNVTRENLGELDLCIKIEVAESDYAEKVKKQLKEYQHKATIPGFRKGMAPMGLIQRMYKTAVVADAVQDLLGESLYKYIDDEHLEILGSPLSNDEKTGTIDFANGTDFTFYFDAALAPQVNIDWSKVDAKLCSIKVPAKDIDSQIETLTKRYGKFETPDTIGEGDNIYGKAVELTKEGTEKEGGINVFCSFELSDMKDAEVVALFVGKKAEEKVVFNPAKAFTPSQLEKILRLDTAAAKKFKSDVEFTISGISRITPAEVNEELFERIFPGEDIKSLDKFRKAIAAQIDKANDEQCQILFVNQVRKQLIDHFDAPMPEAFLKRWILSRNEDKNVTAETIEEQWADTYLPSLKWEMVDSALNKIKSIDPTQNEIVDAIKDILRHTDGAPQEGETEQQAEERLEQAARTIAQDRRNVQQIIDKLYVEKTFALFREQLNPEVEKVTAKEFAERCK